MGPPGWPPGVPPPSEPGWQRCATAWLLDVCPPDYRRYDWWRHHPVVLAWLALRHVDAQLVAMRHSYRDVRVELGEQIGPPALTRLLADLEVEGLRLKAVRRAVALILDATTTDPVPRRRS